MKKEDDLTNQIENQMEQLLENQTLAIDMLGSLTRMKTEEEAITEIRDLFLKLFNPEKIKYVAISGEKAQKAWPDEISQTEISELVQWAVQEPQEYLSALDNNGFRVRISHQSTVLGVIELENFTTPQYCQPFINLSLALTPVCGLVLYHLRTQNKLTGGESRILHTESVDSMPGLSTRRYFFEVAGAEFKRSKRYSRPLSAILIDVDNFKNLTETYSSSAGDHTLVEITRILNRELRESDIRVRMGGEEFLVLLPETNLRYAQTLAERLRRRVAEMSLEFENQVLTVSISLGIVSLDKTIQSLEEFINCGDQALNQAKRNGQNQVATWATPLKEYEPVFIMKETDHRIGFY